MINDSTNFALFIEEWLIEHLGVAEADTQRFKMVILFVMMVLLAGVLWIIGQAIINRIVKQVVSKTSGQFDDALFEHGVFRKLGHLIPISVIFIFTPIAFTDYPQWVPMVERLTDILLAFFILRAISSFITAVRVHLSRSEKYRDKPISSFAQLAKILTWMVGIIFIVSLVIGKNPLYLFSALGAVSAVLLLIFKDTILGFMASIQLTINDMIRIGDWVSVPKYEADGDVMEINLTTIKIRNFDNTISTVPTYFFVADSFTNWRGMQESGGRRIKRAIPIKISSVKLCDEEMLKRFERIEFVLPHISRKREDINRHNQEVAANTDASIVNGRRMTNLGVFRAYALQYIAKNPNVNQDMTKMVRQLAPTPSGIPMEIYCFSALKSWVEYEGVQADIFDHLFAVVPHFDLEVFENPAGADFKRIIE